MKFSMPDVTPENETQDPILSESAAGDTEQPTTPTEGPLELSDPEPDATPKYLVLANAMFWRDPDTGFELSWNTQTVEHTLRDLDPRVAKAKAAEAKEFDADTGNWWIPVSDIPDVPHLVALISLAVKAGRLEYTDDYHQWLIDKQNQKVAQKNSRKRLVWGELNLDGVKNQRQIPRNPSIARGTMTYSDSSSKAYKILQETAQTLKQLLPKMIGAMARDEQRAFLTESLQIEKNGYNRSATPRSAVVDLILSLMQGLGIASGIGIVTEEQEPLTNNVKPIPPVL